MTNRHTNTARASQLSVGEKLFLAMFAATAAYFIVAAIH